MPIIGRAQRSDPAVIIRVADLLQCEPAVIDAILQVEANGEPFDPEKRLVIRPEAHKVMECPLLTKDDRALAKKKGFTRQPKLPAYHRDPRRAGDVAWAWVDRFAAQFGEDAAYWITSFGCPQMMGFNFSMCGYDSPKQMVLAFADHQDEQIEAMGRWLNAVGLGPALRMRSWKSIARVYNGPAYARNNYDIKLREAYEASKMEKRSIVFYDDGVLELGDRGQKVLELQNRLRELGFYVDADGDFGPETLDAVRAFQARRGLVVDGRVGPATNRELNIAPAKEPNQKPFAQLAAESATTQSGVGMAVTGAVSVATGVTSEVTKTPSPDLGPIATQIELGEKAATGLSKIIAALSAITVDQMLTALGLAGIIFGIITIWRRYKAQRLRKVG